MADARTRSHPSRAGTAAARFAAIDRHSAGASREGLLEIELDVDVQVSALLGGRVLRNAVGEDFREQIAEGCGMIRPAHREIEALEAAGAALVGQIRGTTRVVPGAAIWIDERFVRLENLPEARLGHAITRVDV